MSETPRYLIIIPCYNGGDLLVHTLRKAREQDYPILVVDDGSSDNTSEVARSQQVHLASHERNQGKGRALRTGWEWGRERGFQAAVTLDADGQHDPAAIPQFIATFEKSGYHIVVGSRFGSGERAPETPWIRHVSNRLSTGLIRAVTGLGVQDIQCGYRIYDLNAIATLPLSHNGFAMETEILILAKQAGLQLGNQPIPSHYPHGIKRSHYRPVADSWEIAKTVGRIRLKGRS